MASMNEKDYYEVLGVSDTASVEEIRRAFQKKARTYHPDVNKEPGAEERFKEISEAYAVLSDTDKRARYDAMRSGNPFAGGMSPQPSQGAPFDPFMGFGGMPFGGSWRRQTTSRSYNPRAGSDIDFELNLDPERAQEGMRQSVTFQRYGRCAACNGVGSVSHERAQRCPSCNGLGYISVDIDDLLGFGTMNVRCPECEGTGRVVREPCPSCHGSGRTITADEVVVEVPAGSHDGDTIRVEGHGNAGTNGRESGDFVAHVSIPSERLSRRSAMGWQLIGFALPFLLLDLYMGIAASLFWILFPGIIGAWFVWSEGMTGHSRRWWRNAVGNLISGFTNSILFVLILASFMACTPRYFY